MWLFLLGTTLAAPAPQIASGDAGQGPRVPAPLRLPADADVLALVQLAEGLRPGTVEVDDPETLRRLPISIRSARDVPPEAVWPALDVAVQTAGWSLRRDGDRVTLVPGSRAGLVPRVVELIHLDHGLVAAEVAGMLGLRAGTGPSIASGDWLVVEAVGSTLIVGGHEASIGRLRERVEEALELFTAGAPFACGPRLRPTPSPDATVLLRFPPGTLLHVAAKFFCDLRSGSASGLGEVAASDRITFRPEVHVSPDDALAAFELALALHGWSYRPGSSTVLARTGPDLPPSEVPVIAIVAVDDAEQAIDELRRSGVADEVRLVAGREGDVLMLGGADAAVRRVRASLAR